MNAAAAVYKRTAIAVEGLSDDETKLIVPPWNEADTDAVLASFETAIASARLLEAIDNSAREEAAGP